MQKFIIILFSIALIGVGCLNPNRDANVLTPAPARPEPARTLSAYQQETASVDLPFNQSVRDSIGYEVFFKAFGEYVDDRFAGYHVGEDIEVDSTMQQVPIQSIANGVVRFVDWVPGYGGLLIVRHMIEDESINALYGHIDLSSTTLEVNDAVERGQFLANLGKGETQQTDQEREHLHFALYKGEELMTNGYVQKASDIAKWINPADFFIEHGILLFQLPRIFSAHVIPSEAQALYSNLEFLIPAGWEVEYVPSLQALNLYTRRGNGTARERSQVFIRYFDASDFLTLSTVTIHSTEELHIGMEGTGAYVARRYDIEKKFGVPDFVDQPSWRNMRHIVTDFRDKEGKTRYYIFAANPELDPSIYEGVLKSIVIK